MEWQTMEATTLKFRYIPAEMVKRDTLQQRRVAGSNRGDFGEFPFPSPSITSTNREKTRISILPYIFVSS